MNGTSGFQEVRSSIFRSSTNRLLRKQRSQFGTGSWQLSILTPLLTTAISVLAMYSLAADGLFSIELTNQGSGAVRLWVSETKNNTPQGQVLEGNPGDSAIRGTSTAQPRAVIAYADDRPPTLKEPIVRTDRGKPITMRLDDIHLIPIFVWIVNVGDRNFETIYLEALKANARTSAIWLHERQGIAFEKFDITDATGKSASNNFSFEPFTCGRVLELKTGIGFKPGAINVYYVGTVAVGGVQGSSYSEYCGPENIIVLGSHSNEDLLVHELGHAFNLEHIDHLVPAHFDKTNVMHPASKIRNFLTEGQTFRAVANVGSAINILYKTHPESASKATCSTSDKLTVPDCPPVQMRIWPDSGEIEGSAAQPKVDLLPHMEALQVYLDWDHEDVLKNVSEMKDSLQLLPNVLKFKKDLEPEFVQLLEKGLDPKVLKEREQFLEEQWSRREAFLKKNPNLGLKKNDLDILLKITRQEHVDQGREQLIQSILEKAIGALLAIDTPNANLALKNFRSNTKNKMLQEIIDRKLPSPPGSPAGLTVN